MTIRRGIVAALLTSAVMSLPARSQEPYVEKVPGIPFELPMVPIAGGLLEASPTTADPGTSAEVALEPFWISAIEIPWDLYRVFMYGSPEPRLSSVDLASAASDLGVDAVARPTTPYVPMDFGMGVEGYPAISMTQFAARQFTKWLSLETGRFYRLPTEAEWEHACRATLADRDGNADPTVAIWHRGNSDDRYRPVHDDAEEDAEDDTGDRPRLTNVLGNVAEWTLDGGASNEELETAILTSTGSPLSVPRAIDPRIVRGGSFVDPIEEIDCATRRASTPVWQRRDPQFPKSIWYLTDARFVGLRVIRPLGEPDDEERRLAWEPDTDGLRRIVEQQGGSREER